MVEKERFHPRPCEGQRLLGCWSTEIGGVCPSAQVKDAGGLVGRTTNDALELWGQENTFQEIAVDDLG